MAPHRQTRTVPAHMAPPAPARPVLSDRPSQFLLLEREVEDEFRPQMLQVLQRKVNAVADSSQAVAPDCARCARPMGCHDTRPVSWLTLPGAVLSVGCWIGLSYVLGTYFRHFGTFNKTYGTLGAAIALMVWLYWTGFAMLVGAELNAELAKTSNEGKLQEKREPPAVTRIDRAA